MTVNELIAHLSRIRDDLVASGELRVMGNHPGSGHPWGDIKEVRVERDLDGAICRVVVDQGQE